MDEIRNEQRYLCKKYIMLEEQLERWQFINKKDQEKYDSDPSDRNRAMLEISESQIRINKKWKEEAWDKLTAHRAKYGDLMAR